MSALKKNRWGQKDIGSSGGGRRYSSRYLMKGTDGQSSSSENEGTSSSTFWCAGMSALVAVLTTSDTLQRQDASCEGVHLRSADNEKIK